jgi:hypothetical protein
MAERQHVPGGKNLFKYGLWDREGNETQLVERLARQESQDIRS